MGGEPMMKDCPVMLEMGIWIPRPDSGSRVRSLVLNARSFWSCIASDFVARWGVVWNPEGEGWARGAVFA